MQIERPYYLQQLVDGLENGLIKIVTGLRRCGKSYLLFHIFYDYLRTHGFDEAHIIRIDLEDIRNMALRSPLALVGHIDSLLSAEGRYVVMLDEVQHVEDFEDVLNSYLKIDNVDVFATGSNSKFLSSDIITEFRGRGDQIHVYPLSFAEFYSAVGGEKSRAWSDYFTYGGLPHVVKLNSHVKKAAYLRNLYETVYLKDLKERNRIQKDKEFDELVKDVASGIGTLCNPSKLSNTFKSVGKTDLSAQTIRTYLSYMEDAFLIEQAERYDVKGKKYINSLTKLYMTDMGVRNAVLDFRQQEETHIMENIIYNELRIRGYSVDVGVVEVKSRNKAGEWQRSQLEVDFVANQGFRRYYIQAALSVPDREQLAQESNSLRRINDDFKKIIVVKDMINPWYTEDGLLIISLFDFLLDPDSLSY